MIFAAPLVFLLGCRDKDPVDSTADSTADSQADETPPLVLTASTEQGFGFAIAAGAFGEGATPQLAIGDPTADGAVSVYEGEVGERLVTLTGQVGSKEWAGYALVAGELDGAAGDEIVVGAPHYDGDGTDNGRVYVLSAAAAAADGAMPLDGALVGEAGSEFGYALAFGSRLAGGEPGFAVGAPGGSGAVYLYGAADLAAGTPRSAITGDGAPDDGDTGAASPCATSAGGEALGAGDSTGFGSVLAVGDLDGSGVDDLAIGWPAGGTVVVFLDPAAGSLSASEADYTLTGLEAEDLFGMALAIGELETDGAGALAVGAPAYEGCDGAVAIYAGAELAAGDLAPGRTLTLSDGLAGGLGTSLSNGGDLDGDGRDELLVGAPLASTGRAWVLSGPYDASTDLDDRGAPTFVGDDLSDNFGFRVVSAGLFGGVASRPDLAISALSASKATVYFDPVP